MKKLRIATMVCSVLLLAAVTAFAAIHYFQGFEADTFDWSGVTRVSSGTNGVTSAAGSWHGEAASGTDDSTKFGGYESAFPAGGYTTTIDIYLNVDGPYVNDTRFDWISAINQADGTFRRDFVFNAGFYNDVDTTTESGKNRFVISAGNNSTRGSSFPKNPGHDPFTITTSGWYTFEHHFYDKGLGVLAVDLRITKLDGPVQKTWTLSDSTDIIGSTVGGHRYGWFSTQEFSPLAIDNVSLLSINAAASVSACKNGGWQHLTRADGSVFRNQGDCVQYVNTGK
jgi:hypothetical protein